MESSWDGERKKVFPICITGTIDLEMSLQVGSCRSFRALNTKDIVETDHQLSNNF